MQYRIIAHLDIDAFFASVEERDNPNFKKYEKTSKAVMEIIQKYSSHIEQASIDEAYFDLSYLLTSPSEEEKA